jgi:hypothetical protein
VDVMISSCLDDGGKALLCHTHERMRIGRLCEMRSLVRKRMHAQLT